MKNARTIIAVLALGSLSAILLGLTGCEGGQPNDEAPQLRGVVTSIDTHETPEMLVVWDESLDAKLEFDAASLTIPKRAKVFRINAEGTYERISAQDIKVRDVVEVQITGPVRESYPVQAGASQVVVVGEWPASKTLPTPPGLAPPE